MLVRLPEVVENYVCDLTRSVSGSELKRASERLSSAYRRENTARFTTRADRIAYLAVRMPATYAAVCSVFAETAMRLPDWTPASILDVGAGPGTSLWAAVDTFSSLAHLTAFEQDSEMVQLGTEMARLSLHDGLRQSNWRVGDIRQSRDLPEFDLIVASYVVGELAVGVRTQLISMLWRSCRGALVLLEPGTRKGFATLLAIRDQLLDAGAMLAAPCPHHKTCPMHATGDWCHFAARVERTAVHRRLKEGDLGHEDEKFSYLVASRIPPSEAEARIVRHPMRYSGHVKLELCTKAGTLEGKTVTRSHKENYRQAKKVDWGSSWGE